MDRLFPYFFLAKKVARVTSRRTQSQSQRRKKGKRTFFAKSCKADASVWENRRFLLCPVYYIFFLIFVRGNTTGICGKWTCAFVFICLARNTSESNPPRPPTSISKSVRASKHTLFTQKNTQCIRKKLAWFFSQSRASNGGARSKIQQNSQWKVMTVMGKIFFCMIFSPNAPP